jgi:hypothetical protein
MLIPGKTFKLSQQTKRLMCSIVDNKERSEFKRAMVQAELAAAIVPKARDRSNDNKRPQGQAQGSNYKTNDTGTASTAQ